MLHQVNWRVCSFPNDLCKKILRAKNFITNSLQVFSLIIVHGNEYYTIFSQEVASNFETWVYHVEPVGVETTVAFDVALHRVNGLIAFVVKQAALCLEVAFALCKVVVIHKVVTGVIRWVDINHFHLAEIGFTQHFQYIEVVALNV